MEFINDKLSNTLKIKHFCMTTTFIAMKYFLMPAAEDVGTSWRSPNRYYGGPLFVIMIVLVNQMRLIFCAFDN